MSILESFTSMLYCVESEDGDGTMRLALFPDLVCWTGQHVIHVAFSIGKNNSQFDNYLAVSIIFLLICIVVSYTFFDMSFLSKDMKATVHNRGESFLIVLKIILNYTYTFFGTEDY